MKICSVCQNCYEEAATSCTNNDQGRLVESRPGGRQISAKYRLDVLLENGLASETFQATDVTADKSVLIKLIDPNLTGDLMLVRERLNTELQATAKINHPNIVKVIDYGVLGNNEFFIATEMSRGELTLREYLTESGSLSESAAIVIVRQAAEALEAAHAAGIIHRNLSPANLLVTLNEQEDPVIKLQNFDFGGLMQRVITDNASNTEPFLEAFRYFSPEQCLRENVDARTDIYSLGVVLYEMLSGGLLFNEPTIAAIIDKKSNGQPPPINHLHFDVKALLTHTLMRSLNKRPDLRPPTAASFARNLRHLEYITKQFSSFAKKSSVNQPAKKAVLSPEKNLPNPAAVALPVDNSPIRQESQQPQPIPVVKAAAMPNRMILPSVEETVETAPLVAEPLVSDPVIDSEPIYVQKKSVGSTPTPDLTSEPILVEKKNVNIALLTNGLLVPRTQNADLDLPERALVTQPLTESEREEKFKDAADLDRLNSFVDKEFLQEPSGKKRPFIINTGLVAILLAVAVLGVVVVAAMKSWQPQNEQAAAASAPASSGEVAATAPIEKTDLDPVKGEAATTSDKRGKRNGKNEPRQDISNPKAVQNNAAPAENVTGTENEQASAVETSKSNQSRESAKSSTPQAELGASLNNWIEATNSRDVDQQMNYYAPKVNSYYLSRNASPEKVKAEKKRVFENAAVVNIQASKPEIVLSSDGQSARMLFNKKYVIKKGRQNQSGEVVQELQWVKSKSGWKIVSERDVKVIRH